MEESQIEKGPGDDAQRDLSISAGEKDFSPKDEQKARRKCVFLHASFAAYHSLLVLVLTHCRADSSVLALLFLGLLVFQLDRMNIASAITGGFAKDIHITQSTINAGNQIMFMGIVVLEIPSNMLLQHVGFHTSPEFRVE